MRAFRKDYTVWLNPSSILRRIYRYSHNVSTSSGAEEFSSGSTSLFEVPFYSNIDRITLLIAGTL